MSNKQSGSREEAAAAKHAASWAVAQYLCTALPTHARECMQIPCMQISIFCARLPNHSIWVIQLESRRSARALASFKRILWMIYVFDEALTAC